MPYMAPGPGPGSPSQNKVRGEEVCEVRPEEVRWFYRLGPDKPWIQFDGYDSLRIEIRYRHIWQTRWRSGSSAQHRRGQSLNRSMLRLNIVSLTVYKPILWRGVWHKVPFIVFALIP